MGVVGPGLEYMRGIKQQVTNLILHLDDPGVLGLIVGLELLEHGRSHRVHCVGELAVQELNVLLQLEVIALDELLRDDLRVTTDGGREVGEGLLLHCDPGRQCPDHGGQPDAGSGGHG